MKRKDFLALVKEAENVDSEVPVEEVLPLDGIGLHHERRMVSKAGAIGFLRWQAKMLNGSWDMEELENCARLFKRVDLI
jgi:hypothetical protein